jgi:hypothetical protein
MMQVSEARGRDVNWYKLDDLTNKLELLQQDKRWFKRFRKK